MTITKVFAPNTFIALPMIAFSVGCGDPDCEECGGRCSKGFQIELGWFWWEFFFTFGVEEEEDEEDEDLL